MTTAEKQHDNRNRGDIVASVHDAWKFYGNFAALKGVSIELRRGEVHMLLGENGAGKSTLVALLIGATTLSKGQLLIHGKAPLRFNPSEARLQGINAVMQDFSLAPAMSVSDNFHLGRETTSLGLLSRRRMRRSVKEALAEVGLHVPADRLVSDLSRPEQQLLEIARALGGKPGALILDEPTASLSHDESERLFQIVGRLRLEGWAILYITHRMEEIRRLGDRVTVLRDGRHVSTHAVAAVTDDALIKEMVGRQLQTFYPQIAASPGAVALKLDSVTTRSRDIRDVSLTVRHGEIVGIGGLVGSGKGTIGRVVFGLSAMESGTIELAGVHQDRPSPQTALALGCVFLPQDRRGEALMLNRSIGENAQTELLAEDGYRTFGMLRTDRLAAVTDRLIGQLDIRPSVQTAKVEELSGGNQQKVVLARAISIERTFYIFEEPTAGIDVGARMDFYRQLKRLCEAGAAILVITSDLQELINISHRIYVMHDGRITADLRESECTEENVAVAAFGQRRERAAQQ